jgi:hypothetical protein
MVDSRCRRCEKEGVDDSAHGYTFTFSSPPQDEQQSRSLDKSAKQVCPSSVQSPLSTQLLKQLEFAVTHVRPHRLVVHDDGTLNFGSLPLLLLESPRSRQQGKSIAKSAKHVCPGSKQSPLSTQFGPQLEFPVVQERPHLVVVHATRGTYSIVAGRGCSGAVLLLLLFTWSLSLLVQQSRLVVTSAKKDDG